MDVDGDESAVPPLVERGGIRDGGSDAAIVPVGIIHAEDRRITTGALLNQIKNLGAVTGVRSKIGELTGQQFFVRTIRQTLDVF